MDDTIASRIDLVRIKIKRLNEFFEQAPKVWEDINKTRNKPVAVVNWHDETIDTYIAKLSETINQLANAHKADLPLSGNSKIDLSILSPDTASLTMPPYAMHFTAYEAMNDKCPEGILILDKQKHDYGERIGEIILSAMDLKKTIEAKKDISPSAFRTPATSSIARGRCI